MDFDDSPGIGGGLSSPSALVVIIIIIIIMFTETFIVETVFEYPLMCKDKTDKIFNSTIFVSSLKFKIV